MPALMRMVGPSVGRYYDPGPDDLIDASFDGTPMPVTVEVYPFAPATRITGQKLSVNGNARSFTGISGHNPAALQFTLGGDADETAGGINTANLTITDDTGATTHFSLRYFRMAGSAGEATPTPHPATTKAK
jgi:hypothetical protein